MISSETSLYNWSIIEKTIPNKKKKSNLIFSTSSLAIGKHCHVGKFYTSQHENETINTFLKQIIIF